MLEELPRIISNALDEEINRIPNQEEVKAIVMGLNRHSARGPNGMTNAFY